MAFSLITGMPKGKKKQRLKGSEKVTAWIMGQQHWWIPISNKC